MEEVKYAAERETVTVQQEGVTSLGSRIGLVAPPVLLVVLNLFLFGPFTLYQGNPGEFGVTFLTLLKYLAVPALGIGAILTAIGLVATRRGEKRYVCVVFMIGVLLWLQGNILVWKYGLLDGQGVNWSDANWRGWLDGGIWCGTLIVSLAFAGHVARIARQASKVIICLQFLFVAYTSLTNKEVWQERSSESGAAPAWTSSFSEDMNVVHLVLDAFQSDIFDEIVQEDTGIYQRGFEGFTFFKNALGAFPTTLPNIPAILTGKIYRNETPINEYLSATLEGVSIPNVLHEHGFEVDMVPLVGVYLRGRFDNSYIIPSPYLGTISNYERAKVALMIDLTLFRHIPHFSKRFIYNDQRWLLQRLVTTDENMLFRRFGDEAFLDDVTRDLTTNRAKPVYKFFHLLTMHVPLVTGQDCNYAGKALPNTRNNVKAQSRCGLKSVMNFLEKLRASGIYDKSLIILQGDHGSVAPVQLHGEKSSIGESNISASVVASALPVIMIKRPGDKGPMKVSSAPVMLADVPASVGEILKLEASFPGESVFKVDPSAMRERKFYDYRWVDENWQAEYLPPLVEYTVRGSVLNQQSWSLERKVPAVGTRSLTTEKLDFGTDSSVSFLRHSWDGNEVSEDGFTCMWSLGSSASIFISLDKNRTTKMTATLNSLVFDKPQEITVKVDGRIIGRWKMSNKWEWQEFSAIIPPNSKRPEVSVVEFGFSKHRRSTGGKRPLAVLFESILLEEIDF